MIIDWHSHIYTPEEAAADLAHLDGKHRPAWGERGCPMVLENFLDAHHKNGIDISVVTNAAHYLRGKADSEELPAVQRWTDYAAEVQQQAQGHALFASPPSCRAAGRPSSRRPSARSGSSASRASSSTPATRATIPTTTRRGRSGSWCRTSTCR